MTRALLLAAGLLVAMPASAADIFSIAETNRATGASDTPATVPYVHTVDVDITETKGDKPAKRTVARLRIDPSQEPGSRVTVLERERSDGADKALDDLIEQIEQNDPEDQADGFWCSARDSAAFPVAPENYDLIEAGARTVRLRPKPDRMVQLMMGEDDLSELGGRERGIAKKLVDRLEGELHLSARDGLMEGMHFSLTRPMKVMMIAKIRQMDMGVACERAPNGYPFVSRFTMEVRAGAFGSEMHNLMELRVGELTPVDGSPASAVTVAGR